MSTSTHLLVSCCSHSFQNRHQGGQKTWAPPYRIAAGLNPVAAVCQVDRRGIAWKKTANSYASRSADAAAKEILKSMGRPGVDHNERKGRSQRVEERLSFMTCIAEGISPGGKRNEKNHCPWIGPHLLPGSLATASWAAAPASTPPVKGMASTVGLYVYPKKMRKSATQQLTDESQCSTRTPGTQTGFLTPMRPQTAEAASKKGKKGSRQTSGTRGFARCGGFRGRWVATPLREHAEEPSWVESGQSASKKQEAEQAQPTRCRRQGYPGSRWIISSAPCHPAWMHAAYSVK